MPIHVLVHPDEEGGYWAEANFDNGGITAQGDTLDEIFELVPDAVRLFFEGEISIPKHTLTYEVCNA